MKKLLFITLASLSLSFTPSTTQTSTAYICDNGKTKVYHLDSHCFALKRCTHGVVKMTVPQAKGKGLHLCGHED